LLKKLVSYCLFLLLAVPGSFAQSGSENTQRSCRSFVQNFYNWYLRLAEKEDKDECSSDAAIRIKPKAFSSELSRQLKLDSQAQAKVHGEIVGLDFDPFLGAQNTAERHSVGKITPRGSTYWAEVYGQWNGKMNVKPDVVPEVAFQNGRWFFVNFHYE